MGKEKKNGRQHEAGNGSPKQKPDLTPGRQVSPQGGLAATSSVFAHTPLGRYLMHEARVQDLKKEGLVNLAKLEGGILPECELERVEEIRKGGAHR